MLYFASSRDITMVSSETFQLTSTGITLRELGELLVRKYPGLQPVLENSIYAVNMEYFEKNDDQVRVKAGDEVAVIPPMSGG